MTEIQNPQRPPQSTSPRKIFSINVKIFLGNFIIVLSAVLVIGYFIFFRSQAGGQTLANTIGPIVILLSIASLVSYGISNSVAIPLRKLAAVAEEIASGNLEIRAEVNTADEIGILGNTLNSITSTSQQLTGNLEELVAERTQEIENRANQFQAIAEVGQAITAQHEIEELLVKTVHLISSRLGYYHVGIFLLDARNEFAVLRATNSSGGTQMLSRGHQLRVGTEGVVGTVTKLGEARIALDDGVGAVYFDNPDLPQTRSEMALPLIAGGRILGALDIQSAEPNAFTPDDISTLQVLADQLSIAVQNARMFRDTQEALIATRKTTGEISQEGWRDLLQSAEAEGYLCLTEGQLIKAGDNIKQDIKDRLEKGEIVISDDQKTIFLPIKSRGKTIGMLRLAKPSQSDPWLPDEITDLELMASQISNALEGARLFENAQRTAARERIISIASARMRESMNIESVLSSAAQELHKALGNVETEVWVSPNIEEVNKN